jgi:hypothetical protein
VKGTISSMAPSLRSKCGCIYAVALFGPRAPASISER